MSRFTDEQVLAPDFKEQLAEVGRVVQPFVRWCVQCLLSFVCQWKSDADMTVDGSLNDMVTLPDEDEEDSEEDEDAEEDKTRQEQVGRLDVGTEGDSLSTLYNIISTLVDRLRGPFEQLW